MPSEANRGLEVSKSVQVQVNIETAFSFFVERMETWWPASHHIGKLPFVAIVVEPHVGGRWYERDSLGEQCNWGTVLAWDPPHRVCLSWHLAPGHDQAGWVFNPDMERASEVEIRFRSAGPNATVIELEHSKIERHGEGAAALRDQLDGPGAWQGILNIFAERLKSAGATGEGS